jgi:hypothetical protein
MSGPFAPAGIPEAWHVLLATLLLAAACGLLVYHRLVQQLAQAKEGTQSPVAAPQPKAADSSGGEGRCPLPPPGIAKQKLKLADGASDALAMGAAAAAGTAAIAGTMGLGTAVHGEASAGVPAPAPHGCSSETSAAPTQTAAAGEQRASLDLGGDAFLHRSVADTCHGELSAALADGEHHSVWPDGSEYFGEWHDGKARA